jgi:signal transduction histidine kinase
VGLEGRRARSLVVGAVMAALMVAAVSLTTRKAEPFEVVAYIALVLAALIAGEALRARQALQRTLVEEAARASQAAAQHRFDTERLALAHELHDAVGHTLVAVNVRAAATAQRARRAGGEVPSALEDIASASAAALSELRTTLKALRAAQDGPAPLHPVQELAGLNGLITGVREAGHGLRGMQERAAALGGSCEAGPGDTAGWRVRAEIPLREETADRTRAGG